ncbi:hypothetical protein [Paenibacillus sp. Marseille-Q9583]
MLEHVAQLLIVKFRLAEHRRYIHIRSDIEGACLGIVNIDRLDKWRGFTVIGQLPDGNGDVQRTDVGKIKQIGDILIAVNLLGERGGGHSHHGGFLSRLRQTIHRLIIGLAERNFLKIHIKDDGQDGNCQKNRDYHYGKKLPEVAFYLSMRHFHA